MQRARSLARVTESSSPKKGHWTFAWVVASAVATGCGPGYVPQRPVAIAMTGSVYVKDGKTYARDLLGLNLPKLVEDDPAAFGYARAASNYQISGLLFDVVSIVTGVAAIIVALRADDNFNDVGAQILTSATLLTAVAGPVMHVKAADRELDAVNAFNDRRPSFGAARAPLDPLPTRSPHVAWCGFNCLQF